ncbi:unnamed protein product [Rotaria sp. Silwood1]|nr:unnamed protein product [Rotaria sp. Silwood1]CAF4837683.1 unnamed protein product [Rotaria sp. Silwood1]
MTGIKKICFYARGKDEKPFELLDYYSNDIKIFKELGYEVVLSFDSSNFPKDCDLYYIWWWTSGIIPLVKCKIWGKKNITIGNLHYSDPSTQGYFQRPAHIRFFIRYCLRNSQMQLATSKIEYDDIVKLKAVNPKLLYHCIDENKYNYIKADNRENIILTLTQLTKVNIERKKVVEIIKAFKIFLAKFPDYRLYIAGNTADNGFPDIQKLVNELDLSEKISFVGRVSDKEKIALYHKAKVYVQPSDFEGFGMAIAESMACGTPVVTSRAGAVPEVAGDCAVYVQPNNPESIAQGMIELISDNNKYSKLSSEGSKRIKKYFSYKIRKNALTELLKNY